MAKLYGEIAASALLTLDKSFSRALGQPLDSTEIYYSLTAAQEYAAGANAYVGQKIAVIENNVVTHYSIEDTEGTLKELGSNVASDNKSIEVSSGIIGMHDFGKAYYQYIAETEDEEAHYEKVEVSTDNPWKAGLEPKVVTENSELVIGWFEPNPTTIEGINDQVTAVQGSVKDLEDALGIPGDENTEATGIYKEIDDVEADVKELTDTIGTKEDSLTESTDTLWGHVNDLTNKVENIEVPVEGVAADDKILSLTDKLISATLSLSYDSVKKEIKLVGKDDADLGTIDATPFIKDGMLNDVSYNPDSNELTFVWNTEAGEKSDTVVLSDIIEPYTAGEGLKLENNIFSVKIADGSESFLTVSADGLKLAGIQTAIDAAKQAAIDDAAIKYATIETVNGKANKATTLAGYGITDAYTKEAVDELINNINEGNQESAGAVSTRLETYITNNDSRVTLVEEKLATVESNAEKNIIEKIKVNDTELVVDETDRSVNLKLKFSDLQDDSGFNDRITKAQSDATQALSDANAAQATANDAKAAAKQAQDEVDALETTVDTNTKDISSLKENLSNHTTEIANLKQADSDHQAQYNSLVETVNKNSNTIATLDSTYVKNDDSYRALISNVSTNASNISALQSNVNTINNKLGTIPEGSNLVQMIADATYDDTAIKALIESNTSAIATERGRIDDINTRLNTISNVMDFKGVKDEIPIDNSTYRIGDVIIVSTVEYVFDGTEWQAFGDASATGAQISALSNEITALNTRVDNLPLLQVDGTTIVEDENHVISIGEVSTDLLTQGEYELVLNGGSSSTTISNS